MKEWYVLVEDDASKEANFGRVLVLFKCYLERLDCENPFRGCVRNWVAKASNVDAGLS